MLELERVSFLEKVKINIQSVNPMLLGDNYDYLNSY